MKKKFLLVALALACTSAFADTASEQAAPVPKDLQVLAKDSRDSQMAELAQLVQINNNLMELVSTEKASAAPDNNRFCYVDGKAFSEGAVHDGLTCYRDGIRVQIAGQAPKADPLRWAKVWLGSPR